MSNDNAIAPNAQRLLWAGFTAILAAGVGFAIRGGIFPTWAAEYGFSGAQLGAIGGAGFIGFCFGIIIGGVIVDKLGYGKLVALALLGHILSAFVTFGASTHENAYDFLYWGMFLFAYANGTLEAVANPLVATLFPKNRAHYLNILHASWPLGMIVGAVASYVLGSLMGIGWKGQLAFYLVPTLAYAIMFMGQSFPKSEAAQKGASFAEMFKDVGLLGASVACYFLALFFGGILKPLFVNAGDTSEQLLKAAQTSEYVGYGIGAVLLLAVGVITRFSLGSFILFILFITHAMVGAVELGTDQWIESITGNLFTATQGKILFVWACVIMFALRFCTHFIETKLKISPIGILLISAILACVGLNLASAMSSFSIALAALGVYAIGKTFFWPTMLAVVGDRYPRSGAVAMSIMGGVGMLSAGLIGSAGLGYSKDRFTTEALKESNPIVYEQTAKAEKTSKFLFLAEVTPIDGAKLEEAKKNVKAFNDASKAKAEGKATPEQLTILETQKPTEAQTAIYDANQKGDRATLRADSFIPAAMALIYLALLLYFKSIGGYKAVKIEDQGA